MLLQSIQIALCCMHRTDSLPACWSALSYILAAWRVMHAMSDGSIELQLLIRHDRLCSAMRSSQRVHKWLKAQQL